GVLVDIDLHQLHRAVHRGDHLLDGRAELLAGTAPGRPEVDDHRDLAGGLDDVLHEGGVGAVLDQVALGRGFLTRFSDQAHRLLALVRPGINAQARKMVAPGRRFNALYASITRMAAKSTISGG